MAPLTPSSTAPRARSKRHTVLALLVLLAPVTCCCSIGVAMLFGTPLLSLLPRATPKTALTTMWTAQLKFFGSKDDFADTKEQLGLRELETGDYTCFGGPELIYPPTNAVPELPERRLPELTAFPLPGVENACPEECVFTAACAANLDDDDELDVWSISTAPRVLRGRQIPPGTAIHESED